MPTTKKTTPSTEPVVQHQFTDTCWDAPTKQDYLWNPPEELAWLHSKRPKDKVIVQNQLSTPACTFFSTYHVVNWNNVLEDERNGATRQQIDPMIPRNDFCRKRWYWNAGYSIQWALQEAKVAQKITGWASIPTELPVDQQILKINQALDMGYFICTGSANGDWAKTQITHNYTVNGGQFVGHAFCIVDRDDNWYLALNSWWPTWCEWWYFHIPRNVVDKLYSKLVVIDYDDSGYFQKLKDKSKAMTLVRDLKSLYGDLPAHWQEVSHSLADYLRTYYWFNDTDL
jgi:hypothetical protein